MAKSIIKNKDPGEDTSLYEKFVIAFAGLYLPIGVSLIITGTPSLFVLKQLSIERRSGILCSLKLMNGNTLINIVSLYLI
jgi:hypothetical protein